MKRAIVSTAVLIGVFSLGFWTARSPLIVHEEMPAVVELQQRQAEVDARTRFQMEARMNTFEFLKLELKKAEAEYSKTHSAEAKAMRDNLMQKMADSEASIKLAPETER